MFKTLGNSKQLIHAETALQMALWAARGAPVEAMEEVNTRMKELQAIEKEYYRR